MLYTITVCKIDFLKEGSGGERIVIILLLFILVLTGYCIIHVEILLITSIMQEKWSCLSKAYSNSNMEVKSSDYNFSRSEEM